MRVREKDDIIQWFKFFLVGVIETAKNSIETFDGILKLQKSIELKILYMITVTLLNRMNSMNQKFPLKK